MQKKRMSFTKWMIIYMFAGLAAIALVMWILWGFAERFEQTRNNTAISSVCDELAEGTLPEDAVKAITGLTGRVQSDEECVDYVAGSLRGNVSYKLLPGRGRSDTMTYALHCDGKEFCTVTLTQEEEKKFGMRGWTVSERKFDFSAFTVPFEITVPEFFRVSLNGTELGAEWISEDDIHFEELEEYYGELEGVPYKVKYTVPVYFGVPECDVRDAQGEDVPLDAGIQDEKLICSLSDAELERLRDFTDRFLYRYAIYSSSVNDPYIEYNNFAPYILSGSDFEYRMLQARDGLSWMQIVNYVNVDEGELVSAARFGGNVYFLHIRATITTNNTYYEIVTTENNWKVIVVDSGGDLRVSRMDTY